jgi:hypothetical protein
MSDTQRTTLECPCCGDDGAVSDEHGLFYDGQELVCGCNGFVSVEGEDDVGITINDEPCPVTAKCNQVTPCPTCSRR